MRIESPKAPRIRVAGFEGEWQSRKLNESVVRVTRKNSGIISTLPLTISAQFGLVDQTTYFNTQVASKNLEGYTLLQEGEFAYNKSTSRSNPVGAVKRLDKYTQGVLSSLYIAFALKPNADINSDFLVSFFDAHYWHEPVLQMAAEGARTHGLLNISAADFLEIRFHRPESCSEQQAIGAIFAKIDTTIGSHRKKLDLLKQTKTSLLQRMFPADGATVPELRLDGFHDAWTETTLGDTAIEFQSGDFLPADQITQRGTYPVFGGNGLRGYTDKYNHSGLYTLIGRQGALCGNINISDGKAYFTEHAIAVKANQEHDTLFLSYLFGILNLGQYSSQSAQPGLAVGTIKVVKTLVPSTAEEQRAIGAVFAKLDTLINAEAQYIDKLTQTKTALLQKMFV